MTARRRLILYVAAVNAPLALMTIFLIHERSLWLLAAEAGLLASAFLAVRLSQRIVAPLDLFDAGAALLAERDFATRFQPTGDPALDRLVTVYNGMADRLREERTRLEEQQLFLEKIIQGSPSGVLILDFDGRISDANPRAQAMLQEPLRGLKLTQLMTPFARGLTSIAQGASQVLALQGSRRVKVWRSEFLDRGFPRGFFLLEELTDELRRSEKAAYEKVIRMMSHEVNNSLGAASSLLESCLQVGEKLPAGEREDFQGAVRIILGRTAQLNQFMREFAEVARIPPPRLHDSAVIPLIENVAGLLRRELQERRIALRWELDDPLEDIPLDKRQIEQVLLNVLKNAAEAIGQDGTITVRSGRAAGMRFLAIEDTGPGVAEEAREQLFRPFFSTKRSGQGLGLTLAQEILAQHAFSFSLESAPPAPTRFEIRFPQG